MEPSTKLYNLLVIEDNPGDFALVEDFLSGQAAKFRLSHVTSFKAAKEALLAGNIMFDAVLLDLSLPDKTGADLIHSIVALSGAIPVLVLTGYDDIPFSVQSLSMGIADYILKDDLTAAMLYKSIVYSLERKKAMQALENSEKQYSELFQLSPLPIIVFEEATLKFLDVNLAATDEYGYEKSECIGLTIADILPIDDPQAMADILYKLKEQKNFVIRGIVRHKKNEGQVIHVDIKSNCILYHGKKARVVIINDVTERLNHIRAIEEQNEKLREIAWIQSHMVRAPLARILGLVSLVSENRNSREEMSRLLGYLVVSAHELDEVIKDITGKAFSGNIGICTHKEYTDEAEEAAQ